MNTNMNLRPIANIAKRYAKKSYSVGIFNMSEGYEIRRTCHNKTVLLCYNPSHNGSSFSATVREESVAQGKETLASITADLTAKGYTVNTGEHDLQIKVTEVN
jgi:hypothetical protein